MARLRGYVMQIPFPKWSRETLRVSIWWRGFGGRQDFPASSAEYSDFPQCAVFPKIAYSHCLPYPYVVLGSSLEQD